MMENLGNLGDFVGGIGVFATLVYLAMQVRQNTNSSRLTSIQQIISTSVSISVNVSCGPLPAIFTKAAKQDRLTEEELLRLYTFAWAAITNQWQIYHLYRNGMIDREVLDSFMARLDGTMDISVVRAMWHQRIGKGFPADFQEYIQEQLERNT